MKISVLQFKPELGKIEKNFSTVAELTERAKNSDVIVLPELWSTGYYPKPVKKFADANAEKTSEFISGLAKKFSVNIVAGSVIAEENQKFFNRGIVCSETGEILTIYDKVHLFGFAGEREVFSPGNKISTFDLAGRKCGIAVCYDLRFPEFIRKIALTGIEILFVPAAWSLKRLYPRQILTRARAIENQIFLVFANSAGKSETINPAGEISAEAGTGDEILTCEIDFKIRGEVIKNMNLLADRHPELDRL